MSVRRSRLEFLEQKFIGGKWVKREHDAERKNGPPYLPV